MPGSKTLTELDRRILRILTVDGRLSFAKLAERVGMSATPCWNRVQALEKAGVIEGYAAMLNQKALGYAETVFVEVRLRTHSDDSLEAFCRAIADLPEVLEAHIVSGKFDMLLKVAVESTHGHETFLRERLLRLPGIRNSRSTFSLRRVKGVSAPL
jgi:Lrp/AsnC family leucine-responsive transcriptional regulator